MQIDWWTLFFQLLNGLILIWLLTRFLFRPIADIITTRQQEAAHIIDQAKDIRVKAEEQRKTLQSELDNLTNHKNETLEAAKLEAEKLKQSVIQKAQLEAANIRKEATTTTARLYKDKESELAVWANQQALSIATKLMENLPKESQVSGFINGLADSLKKLPAQQLKQLRQSDVPLQILSARELTREESENLKQALVRELGNSIFINISVKPELIAGLEIVGEHYAVRNSFSSHLDSLTKVLVGNEH